MTLSMADWNPNLEVGNPEIDEQHRMLFAMIRELEDRMANKQFLQGALDALQGMKLYAATHFADEEALMDQGDFADLARHKGLHAQFMWDVGRLEDHARDEGEWSSVEVLSYLVEWLISHIQTEDTRFFRQG